MEIGWQILKIWSRMIDERPPQMVKDPEVDIQNLNMVDERLSQMSKIVGQLLSSRCVIL
jgi:hypothetical protein